MRILLSAFACDPEQGSEPGVGWVWAHHLAQSGHDVHVLTRPRSSAQAKALNEYLPNLRFTYIGVRFIPLELLAFYPYYIVWQWKAYLYAKKFLDLREFDCIHHVTYGSFRTPFFLSLLPLPSIFGPVGGGDITPAKLIRGMSVLGRLREWARAGANFLNSLNPMTRLVWRRSALILVATEGTLRMVPPRYRFKCRLLPAITTPTFETRPVARAPRPRYQLRALFVGRLLEWKGLHLAIRAVALAQDEIRELSLSIRGNGPREPQLRALVQSEGLEKRIHWIPRFKTRDEVLDVYDKHDLLLFPSLHDSGGSVVLEAMSRGLPVICLKLGGPAMLVDDTCGACIDPTGRSEDEVIHLIARELVRFANMSEPEVAAIRRAADDRAKQFSADEVIGKAYSWFEKIDKVSPSHDSTAPTITAAG